MYALHDFKKPKFVWGRLKNKYDFKSEFKSQVIKGCSVQYRHYRKGDGLWNGACRQYRIWTLYYLIQIPATHSASRPSISCWDALRVERLFFTQKWPMGFYFNKQMEVENQRF